MSTVTAAHAVASPVVLEAADLEVGPIFQRYQQDEAQRHRTGCELGQALIKWHGLYKAQGNRKGGGFHALLKRLSIPKATAYRWMKAVDPQHFVSRETKSSPFEQERVNPSKRRFSSKRFNACMSEVFSALCGISMALEAWDIETVTIDVNANDLERWLASDREFQKQFNTLIRRLRGHAAAVVPQAATAHTNGDLIQ